MQGRLRGYEEMVKGDTGTAGEYLVASELCRRGFITTTFTRNMPEFDILAIKENIHFKIQVKTVTSGEWSLNAKTYLNFNDEKFKKGVQEVIDKKSCNKNDFFVFVRLSNYGEDQFFVIPKKELINIIHFGYSNYVNERNGIQKINPKTTHTGIPIKDLKIYENKWDVLGGDK
jgi:Holliday junction resolvase-like predicted endonuclease